MHQRLTSLRTEKRHRQYEVSNNDHGEPRYPAASAMGHERRPWGKVDRDVPLSTGWRGVYRACHVETPGDRPCVRGRAWCSGPAGVDDDLGTIGACPDCLAVATAGGEA
jgi:hypothetical protein